MFYLNTSLGRRQKAKGKSDIFSIILIFVFYLCRLPSALCRFLDYSSLSSPKYQLIIIPLLIIMESMYPLTPLPGGDALAREGSIVEQYEQRCQQLFTYADSTNESNYFVAAAKPSKFFDRYGRMPSGNYQNSLSNGGEQVIVHKTNGDIILDFTYDDHLPWPEQPDGNGPSLISVDINPAGDPNDYFYWTESASVHGTPFSSEFRVVIEETLAADQVNNIRIYPNPTDDVIRIQWSNDTDFSSMLRIYDLRGTIYYQQSFYNDVEVSLDALNMSHGIYLFEIISPEGKEVKKVIYTSGQLQW